MKKKLSFKVLRNFCVAMLSMLSLFMPDLRAENDLSILNSKLSDFERVKQIYAKNAPAVVKVFASRKDENSKQFLLIGSGFFIDKKGHIITNATIVYKADNLWIDSNGVPAKATLVGYDPITNISVLKVEKNGDFPVVDLETSFRLPEIADALLMISCELGQDVSPNTGLITGHNIRFGEKILPTVYLRTSIPIFGGSVGAPLFSLDGEFKGVAVAALPEIGGSFVLPARAVNRIKDDILLAQKVAYGWFGLISREISDSVNGTRVIVDIIMPKGPAELAGFEVGDVILAINGRKVVNDKDLRWETFFVRAGESATFRVHRQGKELDIELQVARMSNEVIESQKALLELSNKNNLKKAE